MNAADLPLDHVRQDWDSMVRTADQATAFHEGWCLDALGVDRVLCLDECGRLAGGLPLFAPPGPGAACLQPGLLIPYGGLVLADADPDRRRRQLARRRAAEAAARWMKKRYDRERWAMAPGEQAPDLVPLIRAGYVPELRYTYVLDTKAGFDPAHMAAGRHDDLDRAGRAGLVVWPESGLDRFDLICCLRWADGAPHAVEQNRRLLAAALAAGRGRAFVAGIDDRAAGAVFVIWDDRRSYVTHAYTEDWAARLGVATILYLAARQWCGERLGVAEMDLEGSVLPGVERFYQSFGASQRLYVNLHRHADNAAVTATSLYDYD